MVVRADGNLDIYFRINFVPTRTSIRPNLVSEGEIGCVIDDSRSNERNEVNDY